MLDGLNNFVDYTRAIVGLARQKSDWEGLVIRVLLFGTAFFGEALHRPFKLGGFLVPIGVQVICPVYQTIPLLPMLLCKCTIPCLPKFEPLNKDSNNS